MHRRSARHSHGTRIVRVFNGKYVTITCRKDGTLRPNLKPVAIGKHFNASRYAKAVADELQTAIACLVEN